MKLRGFSILIMLLLLTGCAENAVSQVSEPSVSSDAAEKEPESEITETDSSVDMHNIPTSDYGGRDFNILYASGGVYNAHELYFFADEGSGDALNDAIYKRNLAVNEALNINIKGVTKGYIDTILPEIKKTVQSGDGVYDLALTHTFDGINGMISQHMIYDWKTVPYVDLSKNYWNQNMNDTLMVQGVLPVASSDYMPADVYVLIFNKSIHDNYNLDNYYEIVKKGQWTIEKFAEEVNKVSSDLNGDGAFDKYDLYGFSACLDANFQAFMNACGMSAVELSDTGLVVKQPDDKFLHAIDILNNMIYYSHSVYWYEYIDIGQEKELKFNDGHSLMSLVGINEIETLRTMETDFGILPLPKYNEEQDKYCELSMSGFIVVPLSVCDVELTGKAAELLSYYSAEIFTPVFYDLILNTKYARDTESADMLDIIFDGIVFDYAMVYGGYNEISYSFMHILKKKDTPVVSYFEKNTKKNQKMYDKLYDAFKDYLEG